MPATPTGKQDFQEGTPSQLGTDANLLDNNIEVPKYNTDSENMILIHKRNSLLNQVKYRYCLQHK